MASNDDENDSTREDNVISLIQSIKERYLTLNKESSRKPCKMAESGKKVLNKGKSTIRPRYKLHIGWKHTIRGKKVHIRKLENGGGVRTIEYCSDEPQTISSILEVGKKLFFPDGLSKFGPLSKMKVTIGNFSGQELSVFLDREGKECSLQEYLKSYGIYSSRLHIYLITELQEESENEEMADLVERSQELLLGETGETSETSQELLLGETSQELTHSRFCIKLDDLMTLKPGKMSVKLTKGQPSSYSSHASVRNVYSWEACEEFCFELTEDCYNPIEDGYLVTGISLNDKVFLEQTDSAKFHFPQWQNEFPEDLVIIHGPDVIHGYDGGSFLIGMITRLHGQGYDYLWTKDGFPFKQGADMSIIKINDAGTYNCGQIVGGTIYWSTRGVAIGKEATVTSITEVNNMQYHENEEKECDFLLKAVPESATQETEEVPESSTQENKVVPESATRENKVVPESVTSGVYLCEYTDLNFFEEIGKGAHGVVYRGEWIGTPVAIKQVYVKRIRMAQPKIDRELMVNSSVRHPKIVQLLAYCTKGEHLYLISKIVNGPNLDEVLFGGAAKEDVFKEKKNQIALDISSAVAYLHNISVVHRDIKPENILLEKQTFSAKLCDLGVSKISRVNSLLTTVGVGGVQPGTPAYQAPEVLIQNQPGTSSSDVWSLGCTLFELFTETQIWADDELNIIKEKMQIEKQPSGLQDFYKFNIPKGFGELLKSSFSYCPKERPTAMALLNALKSCKLLSL